MNNKIYHLHFTTQRKANKPRPAARPAPCAAAALVGTRAMPTSYKQRTSNDLNMVSLLLIQLGKKNY